MVRTERESDRRRRKEKWQTCCCCRDQQRACRMAQASVEKLKHIGPAEKEKVALMPQREQLTRTPEPPLPRGKGTDSCMLVRKLLLRKYVLISFRALNDSSPVAVVTGNVAKIRSNVSVIEYVPSCLAVLRVFNFS